MTAKHIKVLHIIVGLQVGGAELMLKRLLMESKNRDNITHEVVSLTEIGAIGSELEAEGFNVYSLNMSSALDLPRTFIKLRSIINKFKPDTVQTWMYHADLVGGLIAKSLGVKNIVWGIRTTDVTQNNSKAIIAISKLCAKLSYYIPNTIICAANASKLSHTELGYDIEKMIVIPNGFEVDKIVSNVEDSDNLRYVYGISNNDIVVGTVGRFDFEKNQKLFVDTAAIIVQNFPNLKFLMVGRDNNTDNKKLMSWIKGYDLTKNFILLGHQSNIPDCLSLMNVFCLHSRTEGFPNVLAEAMAMGVPCVSVDVGDSKYILNDLGTVVDTQDEAVLARAIIDTINLILNKSEKIDQIEKKSRKYIEDNFSINVIYNRYQNVWNV